MPQESVTVLELSSEETRRLKPGVNLISRSPDERFIIFKKTNDKVNSESFRACRNTCKHQGGIFVRDIEDLNSDVVSCTKHGWLLDCSNMLYVNPPKSFKQDEILPEIDEEGCLKLIELNPPRPWTCAVRDRRPILQGEVKFTYFSHACVEIKLGDVIMFTDPWLTGPSFARGWWLLHEPPSDWLDRLAKADLVYISHLHSDHLNYPTLQMLQAKNPNVPFYVGNTNPPVFSKMKQNGVHMNNINVLNFGVWKEINSDLRIMILMDGVHPEIDTCIIIDYKGHLILNLVDCSNPNNGNLPRDVDVLLSDFAGGASGFPVVFYGGRYTEKWKASYVKSERRKLMYHTSRVVRQVNPAVYCPFAGYFIEAHPSDRYIKETNLKNDPKALNKLINKLVPNVRTWTPLPGATLDLGKICKNPKDPCAIQDPPIGRKILKDEWDFDRYLEPINACVDDVIFSYPEWIEFYYKWCNFRNYNLVLRMIETDDDFEPIEGGYDYLVDFSGEEPSFPEERPSREHSYVEVKNRISVHRQTIKEGNYWDDLYLGFNNRISRSPDTFHFQFWNHMQIVLPLDPPDWQSFLQQQKAKNAKTRDVWKLTDWTVKKETSPGDKNLLKNQRRNSNGPLRLLPVLAGAVVFLLVLYVWQNECCLWGRYVQYKGNLNLF
ncbi:cytidine monophosphate-N-acetylneuraminic acid hydroxylase-like [Ptychodera flava]|uniref:cytidine monophosphate-N-acetylneuraminic acid hydroxylase-like n=1 Tax=Ptychodera flava TaxID=63121 RepID=UPI00396A76C8